MHGGVRRVRCPRNLPQDCGLRCRSRTLGARDLHAELYAWLQTWAGGLQRRHFVRILEAPTQAESRAPWLVAQDMQRRHRDVAAGDNGCERSFDRVSNRSRADWRIQRPVGGAWARDLASGSCSTNFYSWRSSLLEACAVHTKTKKQLSGPTRQGGGGQCGQLCCSAARNHRTGWLFGSRPGTTSHRGRSHPFRGHGVDSGVEVPAVGPTRQWSHGIQPGLRVWSSDRVKEF